MARSDLARELTEDSDPDQLISRVALLAARLIPGSDGCVIGLASGDGPMEALTQTDPLGPQILDAEATSGGGPGADVMGLHGTLRIDNTREDPRWPLFSRTIADIGVLSIGVCDLPVTRLSRGVLVVHSARAAAFDDVAELMLPVFASRASIALGYRVNLHSLGRAVNSRQLIGQATGILMERHKITGDEAFQRLVRASQRTQLKLHRIADLVVQTGQDPEQVSLTAG